MDTLTTKSEVLEFPMPKLGNPLNLVELMGKNPARNIPAQARPLMGGELEIRPSASGNESANALPLADAPATKSAARSADVMHKAVLSTFDTAFYGALGGAARYQTTEPEATPINGSERAGRVSVYAEGFIQAAIITTALDSLDRVLDEKFGSKDKPSIFRPSVPENVAIAWASGIPNPKYRYAAVGAAWLLGRVGNYAGSEIREMKEQVGHTAQ